MRFKKENNHNIYLNNCNNFSSIHHYKVADIKYSKQKLARERKVEVRNDKTVGKKNFISGYVQVDFKINGYIN